MKFSEVTAAIHEAWQFCWPPLLALALAYWVASFVYPVGVTRLLRAMRLTLDHYGSVWGQIRDAIQPFGLTPLVPFIGFVAFIASLFIVNMAAVAWTSTMPPYVSFMPDHLMGNRMNA